jgi:CheY-like chemotaxis protein
LDRGSRFSVAVPRAAAIDSALPPPAALRLEPGRLDGMVVLCIDNERAILDGMQTLLSGWGCRVLMGADLGEAMAALAASRLEPDGLLVDYHLDGGNGIAAIRELRRDLGRPDGRDVPAIVITADRSARVRDEARAESAHVLNKPVKPASLRALMMQWRVQRVAAE